MVVVSAIGLSQIDIAAQWEEVADYAAWRAIREEAVLQRQQAPASSITLPDGRRLAYSIFGTKKGPHNVLYVHDTPSCRLEPTMLDEAVLFLRGIRCGALWLHAARTAAPGSVSIMDILSLSQVITRACMASVQDGGG